MIKHLTLRSKIFFIFMIMAAITVAAGIIMLWYTYKIDNMLVTMVQKEIVLYKAAQEMELALANQKGFLTYYFVDGNDKWLESLGKYREVFSKSLDKASSLQLNEQQLQHLTKISSEYEKYIIAKDNAIEKYKYSTRDGDLSVIHGQQRSVFFNLLKLCRNFSLNQWMVMQETEHENNIRSANLRIVTFGAIFFFVILCGLLLFILYKQILEPIRGLAIETGSSPKASSRDEVVSLSLSLKGMMKDFDDTHDELARNRESLVQAERMAMVGEMAAGVAHTIRNPFTSIKMSLILIIDDDKQLSLSFKKILTQDGYDIATAYLGKEGIEKTSEIKPDLVILDIRLPDMSGIDVFDVIHDLFPKLPVIIVTVFGTTETAIEAIKKGAYDYIYLDEEEELNKSYFAALYKQRFGEYPYWIVVYGYDAANVLIDALKYEKKWQPEILKNAIIKISNFKSPLGEFTINKYGDTSRPPYIINIKNGKFVRVQ